MFVFLEKAFGRDAVHVDVTEAAEITGFRKEVSKIVLVCWWFVLRSRIEYGTKCRD